MRLLNHCKNEVFAGSIDYLPIATDIFLASITEFERFSIVGLNKGYNYWKLEFDKGNAGVWDIDLSEAITMIEKTNNQK